MKNTTIPDWKKTAREFNARNKWDCQAALDLAVEVLTDANSHDLARMLMEAVNDLNDEHNEQLDLSSSILDA